ncbi:MAG: hypothetical protein JST51_19225 [Armatimonadetes bacterium]|nr:hypothetical protein [Armatimonadota bacterium]
MRFRILFLVAFCAGSALGFGQDINRAKEWHLKRPEQTQAQVTQEMKFNGAVAPVGDDPSVLDENGDPVASSGDKSGGAMQMDNGATKAVGDQSERLVKDEFGVAGTAVAAPEKHGPSVVLVGGIFLLVGLLIAAGIRFFLQRMPLPPGMNQTR